MKSTRGILNPEDYLKEIIKLQLKKPKRWNWELTTSKSSPHICLPIIQLYDAKGNLLVEAKDSGTRTDRKSWHSSELPHANAINTRISRCSGDNFPNPLRRTASTNQYECSEPGSMQRRSSQLKKSNSAIFTQKLNPIDEKTNVVRNERYKRTRSDDLFKRMLTINSTHVNETTDDVCNVVVTHLQAPERAQHTYRSRTSRAGTLIYKEDSFSGSNRRRRQIYKEAEMFNNSDKPTGKHIRQASDPLYAQKHRDRYASVRAANNISVVNNPVNGLFYSKSDVLQRGDKLFTCTENSNYVVQEPITPTSDNKSVKVPQDRKKRRKIRRQNSDDAGSSSSTSSERIAKPKRKGSKARVVKEHIEDKGDAELVRLVRRLSSSENVKMGANVSRHSSKGLSGRRSQSSGSICKGRRGDNQICGSLPSYLDETDDTSCNNNHDYEEKQPLNDVDRIPPLGDGAPLHWKFSDNTTVLCDQGYGSERSPEEEYPPPLPDHDNQCNHHLDIHSCYPFITPESTFCVALAKGSRGLGLSVTGGIDSGGSWPGLIRVKRLFPHQPAAACGVLNVGDLILEANGVPLTGLTNYEALEVLRTAANQVELRICRPPPDVLNCVSPISEVPPPPPRREPPSSLSITPGHLSSDDDQYGGEFEITMRKMQGSLGFTLRKEDDSALGHYIRALVREPALNDGRIRPGDKIIAVNDVEISSMTHEEAVQFLRQCGDLVKLRLYRDAAQTPVATLSPTETTPRTSFCRKAQLRQEAVDMLNDIAVRKLIPPNQQDSYRHSPTASPRRIRSRQSCPSDASQCTDSSGAYHPIEEQFHEGLLYRGGNLPLDEESFNSLFIDDDDCDRPSRPSSLDIYNPNQTPVACRKPKFNFSLAHNAYELNNLDAEILDAPNLTYNIGDDVEGTEVECGDSFPKEHASMPYIPTDNPGFSYKNPAYQSAHPPCGLENGTGEHKKAADDSNTLRKKSTGDEPEKKPRRKKSIKETKVIQDEPQILSIELNRGWNSRLGFSLQGPVGHTYVSAVHADSVAAKDGRIKAGDRLIKVNDESVEHLGTNEIIDLLRIVRGPVCIVVIRNRIIIKECIRSN